MKNERGSAVDLTQLRKELVVQRQRMKENEQSLREMQDTIKHMNIHIMKVPEGDERREKAEKIFEEMIAESKF